MNTRRWTSPLAPSSPQRLPLAGVLTLSLSLAGCFAAPTPHPENGLDAGVTAGAQDVLVDSAPAEARYADACATSGGRWDAAAGLCDLDFSAGIDDTYADEIDAASAPSGDEGTAGGGDANGGQTTDVDAGAEPAPATLTANVTGVEVSGDTGTYTFSVTTESPDTGCDQYADWWEVLRPDGTLVYRHVLTHSHVDEQPFTRDGGPVELAAGEVVVVRAHLHGPDVGYGPAALVGTAEAGFAPTRLPAGFAWKLTDQPPQPSECQF